MILSTEQIERLHQFCKQHYVQHYDVQVELVDHLANAIEEKMNACPGLPFEAALAGVYAGFGITGFSHIVAARTRQTLSSARRLRWKLFCSYFSIPKLAMTACLFLGFALLPNVAGGGWLFGIVAALWVALFIFEVRTTRYVMRLMKQQKLPLLLTQANYEAPFLTSLTGIQFIIFGINRQWVSSLESGSNRIGYFILTSLMILIYVSLLAYRQHADKLLAHARAAFPEAFSVAG
jgi:uncharacterized membrane protein (DUF485 family)